jgi:hypothetical protein
MTILKSLTGINQRLIQYTLVSRGLRIQEESFGMNMFLAYRMRKLGGSNTGWKLSQFLGESKWFSLIIEI